MVRRLRNFVRILAVLAMLACIGFSKEENPFELSNAIVACRKTRAIQLVDKLLDDGEEPVAVLSKMTYPILKMARIKRLSEAGLSPAVMQYILGSVLCPTLGGSVQSDEIGLPVKNTGLVLPCGATAIWQHKSF